MSDFVCEHGNSFALCSKCKGKMVGKMGPLWLMDSGVSTHFTSDINDFIEYMPLPPKERSPVKTAAHTIYVEGCGTVLLKHKVHNTTVTTRLHPVLYIPKLSV
jgi:hypothetical protein